MKDTFLFLKTSSLFLVVLLLASCGDHSYSIDFNSLQFPEINETSVGTDVELYREIKLYSEKSPGEVRAVTDKTVYQPGEEVVLTIENHSNLTEYFYPSDEQVKQRERLFSNKSLYLKSLVSKDPGIKCELLFNDPRLVFLILEGTNSLESSEYGIKGFDEPLDPGEKMVFKMKLPKRPGRYQISLIRYSHGKERFTFGVNAFIYSNIFEVVN